MRRATWYVVSAMVALLFLLPLVAVLLSSVKSPAEASQSPPTYVPRNVSFENYTSLDIGGSGIWSYLVNSALVSLGTVAGTVVVATLGAFGLSRYPFWGSKALLVAILAAIMVPFQVLVTPLYVVLGTIGLDNSLVGLALVYVTFQLPFSMFLMRNSFDAVPQSIYEAAAVDGASRLGVLRLVLPLVAPGLATCALFAFFAAWNEFIAALILLSDQEKFTLPIMLTTLVTGELGSVDWGVLQAGVVLTIVPCVVIFLALQRHYVRGLTAGAVK